MTQFIIRNQTILDNCIKWLRQAAFAKTWAVTIEEFSEKRSLPQNSLYWTWLDILSNHTGHTKDELHEEYATRLLGTVERMTISKTLLIEPVSTKTLSKAEFSDYMDKIMASAAALGVVLPQGNFFGYDD